MANSKYKKFTLDELAKYNGKDGSPSYIAYKGKLYDVTGNFLWRNGKHQVLHQAGQDLTEALDEAPHGDDLMKKIPIIAEICNEKDSI